MSQNNSQNSSTKNSQNATQSNSNMFLPHRPRRLRKSAAIRNLVAENEVKIDNLVYPLFFKAGTVSEKTEFKTLPDLFLFNEMTLLTEIEECMKLGLFHFALFPQVDHSLKNSKASEALNPKGLVPQMIRQIKKNFPEAVLFSDIALDPFSSDGHDGLVRHQKIVNDETVEILAEMALLHAYAGVDFVCPSDMMDGRIGALREKLEEAGFTDTGILSYSAKYASSFYGPFREALNSAPKAGDKKTYQMDFRNSAEALIEVELDIEEGADIVMVKPGLPYLDVIHMLAQTIQTPIAAYNVSGEYAMIKFAAKAGAIEETLAVQETLTAFRRAGAQVIFTYFAKQWAQRLKK